MKEKTPPKGSLRDFRIDSSDVAPVGASIAPKAEQQPTQRINMRQSSSVSEWSGGGVDELWPSWEAEARREAAPQQRVAIPTQTPIQSPSAPEATPNHATPNTLASETTGPQPWAAELALDERRMERAGEVGVSQNYNKQDLLKRRTLEFVAVLHQAFREHVEIFNDSRRSAAQAVRVFRVSGTEQDFMLFRNGIKLMVSGQRAGRVLIAFNQYLGPLGHAQQSPSVEIEAAWGPFDQLFWNFKGERVQVLDLVRYFLTEFVRQSVK